MPDNDTNTRLAVLEALSKERFDRIDKDLAEIKKEIIPLKIKVYAVSGAIAGAISLLGLASRLF